ncbi:hypothetical protein KY335_04835 [Candidatus Woesearchaeota archaeon]|nr:hypothetical protein [Candidatus Woesearchaeota archaeon]
MTETSSRLVLKIFPEKKDALVKRLLDLEKTPFPEGQRFCRVMWGLKEAAVVFNVHVSYKTVMEKLFDFYLQRSDAKTMSRNINSLAEMSPYHQALYLDVVDFVISNHYGELTKPDEEMNLLERARAREKQRDTLTRRKTTVRNPAGQYKCLDV